MAVFIHPETSMGPRLLPNASEADSRNGYLGNRVESSLGILRFLRCWNESPTKRQPKTTEVRNQRPRQARMFLRISNMGGKGRVHERLSFLATMLGPVKIKMAGWREEEMRCRTRRERGSVVTALQDRKSNADPAHQQPSPLGCRSFAAMLCCPRESRPQGYCLSYAPRLAAKLLAPPPAF